MTIGRVVSVTLTELKKQRDTASRQLSAETLKTTDKKSKKFSAVSKEKTAIDRNIEGLTALVENIFTSIFIHRHKDTHVEIRANCASSFGDWVWNRHLNLCAVYFFVLFLLFSSLLFSSLLFIFLKYCCY
jgi:hypothetical protein